MSQTPCGLDVVGRRGWQTFSPVEPNERRFPEVGTVRWNVAETDSAPVSAAQVEMYLSTDGVTFSSTPFATTANDGYAGCFHRGFRPIMRGSC